MSAACAHVCGTLQPMQLITPCASDHLSSVWRVCTCVARLIALMNPVSLRRVRSLTVSTSPFLLAVLQQAHRGGSCGGIFSTTAVVGGRLSKISPERSPKRVLATPGSVLGRRARPVARCDHLSCRSPDNGPRPQVAEAQESAARRRSGRRLASAPSCGHGPRWVGQWFEPARLFWPARSRTPLPRHLGDLHRLSPWHAHGEKHNSVPPSLFDLP